MSTAVICSMPAEGHVRPLLVVAAELQARGWRVRMLTGARYASMVRAAGVDFVPLPPEADTLDELGAGDRKRGRDAINSGVEQAFFAPAPLAGQALLALLAEEPTDVVLHEPTFVGVQALHRLAPAERPFVAMCGIIPLGLSSRDTPPYGLGITPLRRTVPNRVRNAVLTAVATRLVLRPVHRAADRMLADMGAPGLRGRFFMDVLRSADLHAQFTVPAFEFPRSDAPESLRYYGPMTRVERSGLEAPPWFAELGKHRPVVHVTQGTVANTDFTELVRPTVEALADLDVDVVVTTGGRPVAALTDDLAGLAPRPERLHVGEFLPYDKLLPLTDVLVTNGGYGGLHHALQHGVPIVVAGDSEDKVETSARVAWSGAGIRLGTSTPTVAQVRAAVQRILGDPSYARASRAIGDAIATSPGPVGFVDDVEEQVRRRQAAGVA
ncbi:nucleotide disphospho-sugar-binding domain-containing protein [Nocardioides zeae]|uniref:Glycosyltransferase n=1 Tax=Nocardioides zeae TaxID=1457234 RepID=A0A6P0HHB6_9ACTN|nr:glycosyltransferase [Nocardioides zeae]